MSDVVYTLAVWDVGGRSWMPLLTSPVRSRVEAMNVQLTSYVMVFTAIVEVPRSDDDAVVAALEMLEPVNQIAVATVYLDLAHFAFMRERNLALIPPVAN